MGKKGSRPNDLLLKAAEALEKGTDPFSHGWLSENEVTLDECFSLSERIAVILKGHLASRPEDQMKQIALGAVYGEPGVDLEVFRTSIEKDQALKKLKALAEKS